MAGQRNAEQVRADKLAAMPAPLGELHFALWHEVAWLHMKWRHFCALYANTAIPLLKAIAPRFFYDLRRTLWEDVLLHICRLTDPPKSAGKATLTLRRLRAAVPDGPLREQVEHLVADAVAAASPARERRNRLLAHKELPPLGGQEPQPLADISNQQTEDVLALMRKAMNCVELEYEKSETSYEYFVPPFGGVDSLLFYLGKGLDAQKREDAERQSAAAT